MALGAIGSVSSSAMYNIVGRCGGDFPCLPSPYKIALLTKELAILTKELAILTKGLAIKSFDWQGTSIDPTQKN